MFVTRSVLWTVGETVGETAPGGVDSAIFRRETGQSLRRRCLAPRTFSGDGAEDISSAAYRVLHLHLSHITR